jgi:hypothetical protein
MSSDADHIINRLVRMMRIPQNTTAFFINGLTGSGKSHLLKQIADQVTSTLPRIMTLGTYSVAAPEQISPLILNDCYELGLLKTRPPDNFTDFALIWNWLNIHINAAQNQSLLVLIEVPIPIQTASAAITLFSAIRALESTAEQRRFGLHFVVAGYWSHSALESYFNQANISFPYTVESNYHIWNGISEIEMTEMIPAIDHRPLWGRLLYELTGGIPGSSAGNYGFFRKWGANAKSFD